MPRIPTPAFIAEHLRKNILHERCAIIEYMIAQLVDTTTGVVTHALPPTQAPYSDEIVKAFVDADYHCRVHDRGRSITVALPELKHFDTPVEDTPPPPRPREEASNVPALVAAVLGTVAVLGAVAAWVLS